MLSFFIFLKPAVIPSSHLWSSLGRARSEDGSISISIGRAQSVIKNEPHFWWGGWTHVQRTRVESGLSGFRRRRQQEATNGAPGIATRSKDATMVSIFQSHLAQLVFAEKGATSPLAQLLAIVFC